MNQAPKTRNTVELQSTNKYYLDIDIRQWGSTPEYTDLEIRNSATNRREGAVTITWNPAGEQPEIGWYCTTTADTDEVAALAETLQKAVDRVRQDIRDR